MITCKLCAKKLHFLTTSHLKKCSNITLKEYRIKFPNVKITSDEVITKKKENALSQWRDRSKRNKITQSIRKSSNSKTRINNLKKSLNSEQVKRKKSKISIESWKDFKTRSKRISNMKEAFKKSSYKLKQSNSQKNRYQGKNGKAERQRKSEQTRKSWNDPDIRSRRMIPLLKKVKSKEYREKQSTIAINRLSSHEFINQYQSGWFYSKKNNKLLHYRSSYELKYYKILENDATVLKYIVEPLIIKYRYKGITRNYKPDLLIHYNNGNKCIVEIKPIAFLDSTIVKNKVSALRIFCRKNNFLYKIITEADLELNG